MAVEDNISRGKLQKTTAVEDNRKTHQQRTTAEDNSSGGTQKKTTEEDNISI